MPAVGINDYSQFFMTEKDTLSPFNKKGLGVFFLLVSYLQVAFFDIVEPKKVCVEKSTNF